MSSCLSSVANPLPEESRAKTAASTLASYVNASSSVFIVMYLPLPSPTLMESKFEPMSVVWTFISPAVMLITVPAAPTISTGIAAVLAGTAESLFTGMVTPSF